MKAFGKLGFRFDRQTGSHIIPVRAEPSCTLSVPNHRSLAPGTLRALLRDADVSVAAFQRALR